MKKNYSNSKSYEIYKRMINNPAEIPFHYTYGGVNICGFDADKIPEAVYQTVYRTGHYFHPE